MNNRQNYPSSDQLIFGMEFLANKRYDPMQSVCRQTKAVFLVGPSPRSNDVPSWRPHAVRLLLDHGYDGYIFIPEPRDGVYPDEYTNQFHWEIDHLEYCTRFNRQIIAWVPRELTHMPAFTTNVEFGHFCREKNHFFYGRPSQAPKTRYLDALYELRCHRKPANHLEELILQASF